MPRKKNVAAESPELPVNPEKAKKVEVTSAPAAVTSVSVVEYQPLTTSGKWRVGAWEMFQAEFPMVDQAGLPLFHGTLLKYARAWMIIRRLFGVQPVLVDLGDDPDDMRMWGRVELCEKLGISKDELNAELEHARAIYGKLCRNESYEPVVGFENKSQPNLLLAEDNDEVLLKKYGYNPRLFEILVKRGCEDPKPRSRDENETEKAWFAGRVRQFQKVLESPVVQRVADQVLRCELRLRRAEDELMMQVLGTTQYAAMQKDLESIRSSYQEQIEQLDKLAPWFNASEREVLAKDAFSEIIRAVREYRSRNDTKLLDGIFTAYEVQVLLRTSVQKPLPDYRMGWVTYVNESRQWMFDPMARSRFRPSDLRKLDVGFQEAVRRFVEETGEPIPDLESDKDEFEDIYVPAGESQHKEAEDGEKGDEA